MRFIVRGGKPLSGTIELAGAKIAAPKLMIASLLTEEPCVLENFPRIGETEITVELCKQIGSEVLLDGTTITLITPQIRNNRVLEMSRRNRIPILALGPLLARTGEAEVPILGGDKIGPRPVDIHISALEALGAKISVTSESYRATVPHGLRGAEIVFRFYSSVLCTALVLKDALLQNATELVVDRLLSNVCVRCTETLCLVFSHK